MSNSMFPVIYDQFPTDYSPLALWHLDGDLLDSSGNGHDLGLTAGVAPYCPGPLPGHQGLNFPTSLTTYPRVQVTDAAIPTIGALTVGCVLAPTSPSAVAYAYACGVAGSAVEADNYSFAMRVASDNSIEFFWEQGAGAAVTISTSLIVEQWRPTVVHCRRSAGGDFDMFLDGYLMYSTSGLPMPTGGANGVMSVGALDTGASQWRGLVSDLAIYQAALTDVQIQALAAAVSRVAFGNWAP